MDKKSNNDFADKIRALAKSIYESADSIASNTEGRVEIIINCNDATVYFDIPRHYIVKEENHD